MRLWLAALLAFLACPAFAQTGDMGTSFVRGTISWDANVKDGNFVKHRKGECMWDMEFMRDGAEVAHILAFRNTDVYYPFGIHRPPAFGDQMVRVETTGSVPDPLPKPLPPVGKRPSFRAQGQLTWQMTDQGGIDVTYTMPTYNAASWKTTFTWDGSQWARQGDPQPVDEGFLNVFCGPHSLRNVSINGTVAAGFFSNDVLQGALKDVPLRLNVPKAHEDYRWNFWLNTLPCGGGHQLGTDAAPGLFCRSPGRTPQVPGETAGQIPLFPPETGGQTPPQGLIGTDNDEADKSASTCLCYFRYGIPVYCRSHVLCVPGTPQYPGGSDALSGWLNPGISSGGDNDQGDIGGTPVLGDPNAIDPALQPADPALRVR